MKRPIIWQHGKLSRLYKLQVLLTIMLLHLFIFASKLVVLEKHNKNCGSINLLNISVPSQKSCSSCSHAMVSCIQFMIMELDGPSLPVSQCYLLFSKVYAFR